MKGKGIRQSIEDLEMQLKQLKAIEQKICKPSKNFQDLVFKKYIELESVTKVKEFLDNNGNRKDNGSKYITNDISEILTIKSKVLIEELGIDKQIVDYTQALFKNHKSYANKRWN